MIAVISNPVRRIRGGPGAAGQEVHMGDQERRRRYLINKGMQLKYVVMLLVTVVTVNVVVGVGIYFSVWRSLEPEYSKIVMASKIDTAQRLRGYEDARYGFAALKSADIDREATMISDSLTAQLKGSFSKARMKIFPIVILLLIVIFLEGIFLSNRIAGPIYHAEKSMRLIREGNLTLRTFFRKHDEFKDLYKEINAIAAEYEQTVAALRKNIREIESAAQEIASQAGSCPPEAAERLRERCGDIARAAGEGSAVLARYTVGMPDVQRKDKA
jgi:methyl-accepting chemotaxis protein